MVTLVYERFGRERRRGFTSFHECVHSTAILSFDGALRALAIYDDSGRLWRGDTLLDLLYETAKRHGWV